MTPYLFRNVPQQAQRWRQSYVGHPVAVTVTAVPQLELVCSQHELEREETGIGQRSGARLLLAEEHS